MVAIDVIVVRVTVSVDVVVKVVVKGIVDRYVVVVGDVAKVVLGAV